MKKITLLLMSFGFVLASFAQMNLKKVNTTSAPLKMQSEQIVIENENPSIFAETPASPGPDSLWPQAFYQGCWDGGLYYSYFPAVEGVTEMYMYGNNIMDFGLPTMAFLPKFHNDRISVVPLEAPLGGNRKVTGVMLYIRKNRSSLVDNDTITVSAHLAPAVRTTTWESFANGAPEEQIYIPVFDKMQKSDIKLWTITNTEGKPALQRKVFNFATPLSTDAPFTISIEFPWNDSTANTTIFTSPAGCVGTELYASTMVTNMEPDAFWKGDPYEVDVLPESSIQKTNKLTIKNEKGEDIKVAFFSAFAVGGLFSADDVGTRSDFVMRPIINTMTANDNAKDLQFQASVYPSPATNEFTVISAVDMTNISIFNVAGQKVKSIVPTNANEQLISTETLTNGLYIVKMDTKQGSITKKVMINK